MSEQEYSGQENKEIIPAEPQKENPENDKNSLRAAFWRYRRFVFGALMGVAAACLFMWLGFWKTVFILVMAGAGAYIFGVDRKTERLKSLVNKLFPPRS